MSRNWLLAGLASALIAAVIVVIAVDVDEEPARRPIAAPELPPEVQVGRLMRMVATRVLEHELLPRVADLEGTQVIDGSRGTATVRRVIDGDHVEARIMFDAYVLRLDPKETVENEIQADGTVTFTRDGPELRVQGTDVRLGVFDVEQRQPRIDTAGRFTLDLSGREIGGLSGEVVRNGEERLQIALGTLAP